MENTSEENKGGLMVLQSIGALIERNDAEIAGKVERALSALSAIKVINSKEDDEYANNVLVKCNKTLPTIEGLRKEYTSKLDEFKKSKMELENKLKNEMDRVKKERDSYKAREAAEANEKRVEIEKKQKHDQHYADCKTELVAGIELGIANRITKGEEAISKLFDMATLETVDQLHERLSKEPSLDEKLFNSWIDDFDKPNADPQITWRVDYSIVSKEEIDALKERAHAKFKYADISAKYIGLVKDIQAKWKGKIPERKEALQKLAKASADEAAKIKAQQAETKRKADEEIAAKAKAERDAIENKRTESKIESATTTTFNAQVQAQTISEQNNTRKKVVYRFADEDKIINNQLEFVTIMSNVLAHVVTDKDYMGPFKRDRKTKFVKKDPTTGETLYLDEIQAWLDFLGSIKPTPDIPGLIKTEVITSVAREKKDEY